MAALIFAMARLEKCNSHGLFGNERAYIFGRKRRQERNLEFRLQLAPRRILIMKKFALLVLLMAVALVLMAPKSFAADDAKATFAAKCAMCHGANGEGKGTFPALNSGEVQKLTDAQVADIIAKGKNGKASHAFEKKGLDEATIKGLVAYIRTLKK